MKSMSCWPGHEHGREQFKAFPSRRIYFLGKLEIISGQVRITVYVPCHLLKAKENLERGPSLAI